MNLLTSDPPVGVCVVDGELRFDFECDSPIDHDIAHDYRSILDIIGIFHDERYTVPQRLGLALRVFFLDNLPDDHDKALAIMNRFIDCDIEHTTKTNHRTYDWQQDGTAIYTGINKTNNYILDREPYLHWWKFIACFMDMTGECQFNDITSNRLAHSKGKATKEQKEARRQYPEIYVLHEHRKIDDETENRAKELEKLMNA